MAAHQTDRQRLKALSQPSDAIGSGQFAAHLALLAATGVLVANAAGGPWLVPAMLLHGIPLVFLFAPLHETIHRTAFRSRALNDSVAWLCGAVLVLPPEYFRAFHLTHHRFTQDPARDPELAVPRPQTLGGYLWHVSGLPYWRDRVTTVVRHSFGRVSEPFIIGRERPTVVREARLLLTVYVLVAAGSLALQTWAAVLYWVGPILLAQPLLRLFLLAEHVGCPFLPDMLRNSRTTRSTALVRRLAWNMPYHAEHHYYPALPFHALPRAHALLRGRIAVQARGYTSVHRQLLADFARR